MKLRRGLRGLVWILVIGFMVIQFFPPQSNSGESSSAVDFIEITSPPPEIIKLIAASCYDCHSNQTKYPWYSKVQPFGWLLQDHIDKGKADLNFSEYGEYSGRRKRMKLKSSISQIENGEMPLFSYRLMHSEARLSEQERQELIDFLTMLKDKLE